MMSTIRLSALLTLLAALLGCGPGEQRSASADNLRRGLGGEPSTLDPAGAADTFSLAVIRDLYEGLTSETPTGEVIPGVASSWTVDANGTQYTFQLRPDALWSNGRAIRAEDFVKAWRRVVDPKQGSPLADDLRIISGASAILSGKSAPDSLGVYAPSDNVLVVKLEMPAPYLPQVLTHSVTYPIYSAESATSHSPETWVSNGPYVLSSWAPGTAIELTRNPNYSDRANVRIPKVTYQIVSDENAQLARYRAGEIDITDTVPANALPALKSDHSKELVIAPFLATAYYGLNLAAPPFKDNRKLRQAVTMAIDRKRLVGTLGFGQLEAYGFVPPGTWNYTPQTWQWKNLSDDERIQEARRLYAEAGYSERTPLHLRLLYNSNPTIKNTAIVVASMWKETLGVDTQLMEEEYRAFLQSRMDKTGWDVLRLGWTADFNDASNFLDIFRNHSGNNDSDYINASYDASVGAAAQTADPQLRRSILETSERTMLEDYPIIPLYFYVSKRLVKTYVHGVQPNPLNRIRSKDLTIIAH
jgi:oligopeptide transport system substrate-binding protein